MSFANIKAKTVLSLLLSSTEATAFYSAPETIYNGSSLARSMIDSRFANPEKRFNIFHPSEDPLNTKNNPAYAYVNTGRVYIQPSFPSQINYITPTGKAVQCDLVHILLHELGHALTVNTDSGLGKKDN
jgi:hypothetical protein